MKGKMASFTSSLSPDSDAFAIFVNEKNDYKDKKGILSKSLVQKINSFINTLKVKKKDDEINSFDISDKQKCFIIKVKKEYESFFISSVYLFGFNTLGGSETKSLVRKTPSLIES